MPRIFDNMEQHLGDALRESARETLNRQLRTGITDDQLAQLVIDLRADNRLCLVQEEIEPQEPQIICSLGLYEA